MRRREILTALAVSRLTKPGRHADGGNLYLYIGRDGTKKWTFMFVLNGRQREMGFGRADDVPLKRAREKAADARGMLADGKDPLEAKQAAKRAEKARKTFGEIANEYFDAHRGKWSNAIHVAQWRQSIDVFCKPLLSRYVEEIVTHDVVSTLRPMWKTTPETASRVRARIEAILDSATAQGLRQGDNPARWKGHIETLLPARQAIDRGHHAALAYADVPAFLAKLRGQDSVAAIALEFAILTAARAGEVTGASWPEFDLAAKVGASRPRA